jgi:hypothetical protein
VAVSSWTSGFLVSFLCLQGLLMKSTETAPSTGQKLPYSAPTLTIHGDLRTMTAAKGGRKNDAGHPKTFTPGGPA